MNGVGPPRKNEPNASYGSGSVSDDGSHSDVSLLNVGGLALYVGSYGFGVGAAERRVVVVV